ncbi:hypothetical protein ACFYOD_17085 [Streptomyces sp. NPDC006703]
MITRAFATRAKDGHDQLALDIAAAQRDGKPGDAEMLYERFKTLKDATTEHSSLLSNLLDDTMAALQLVTMQLGALLATAEGDE